MRSGLCGTAVYDPCQGRGDERFAAGDLHTTVAEVDGVDHAGAGAGVGVGVGGGTSRPFDRSQDDRVAYGEAWMLPAVDGKVSYRTLLQSQFSLIPFARNEILRSAEAYNMVFGRYEEALESSGASPAGIGPESTSSAFY